MSTAGSVEIFSLSDVSGFFSNRFEKASNFGLKYGVEPSCCIFKMNRNREDSG